jgi:hypothetical protein
MHSQSTSPRPGLLPILAATLLAGCSGSGGGGGSTGGGGGGGGGGGDLGPLVGGSGLCLPSGFCWENPLPQGNALTAVWGASPSAVWAVGGRGNYVLRFDGAAWSAVAIPVSTTLRSVHGRSADDVWAVGDGSAGVHWNGSSWTSDPVSASPTDVVNDVFVASNGDAYAALDYNAIRRRPAAGAWSSVGVTTSCSWKSIWGSGASLWAGGESGYWSESTDGTTWTTTRPGVTTSSLGYDVWASAANDLWRSRGTLVERSTDGVAWTGQGAGLDESVRELTGTAAGVPWALGSGTKAFRWNGAAWAPYATTLPSGHAAGLWIDGSAGWAVGASGRMARFDGGAFTEVSGGERDVQLLGVSASGGADAWAYVRTTGSCTTTPTGCGGALWRRDATGWHVSWTLPWVPSTGAPLWGAAADDVWLSTAELWHVKGTTKTADAKLTFATAIHGSGPTDVWAYAYDEASSRSSLWQWNGSTWTDRSPGDWTVTTIHALAPDDVWAAGRDATSGYHLAHWNGTSWTPRSIETPSPYVGAIWAAATDDVWLTGPYGRMFHWNGSSFQEVPSGTNRSLSAISGTGPNDVWAVGQLGTVLHWNGSAWSDAVGGADLSLTAVAAVPGQVWIGGGNGLLRKPL